MNRNSQKPYDTCLGLNTEVLTEHGWKSYDQVIAGEQLWVVDPRTRTLQLSECVGVVVSSLDEVSNFVCVSGYYTASTPNHGWVDNLGESFTTEQAAGPKRLLRIEDVFPADFSMVGEDHLTKLAGVVARWGAVSMEGVHPSVVIMLKDIHSTHLVDTINQLIERCYWGSTTVRVDFQNDARETTWRLSGKDIGRLQSIAFAPYPYTPFAARSFLAGYCSDSDDYSRAVAHEDSTDILDKVQQCAVLAGLRTYVTKHHQSGLYGIKFFGSSQVPEIQDELTAFRTEDQPARLLFILSSNGVSNHEVWSPVTVEGCWIARIRGDHGKTPYGQYTSSAFITGNRYGS